MNISSSDDKFESLLFIEAGIFLVTEGGGYFSCAHIGGYFQVLCRAGMTPFPGLVLHLNFSYIRTNKVSEQGQGPKYRRFCLKGPPI